MKVKAVLIGLTAAAGLALFGGATSAAFAAGAAPAPQAAVVENAPPPFYWVYEYPFPWVRLSIIDDAAQVMGIPVPQVRDGLQAGQSLVEIGAANGVGEERLENGILRDEWGDLVRQVRNTPLTRREADAYYRELAEHIEGIVHHHG